MSFIGNWTAKDGVVKPVQKIVVALVRLIVQQLNVVRAEVGLSPLTKEQVRDAIKAEIATLDGTEED